MDSTRFDRLSKLFARRHAGNAIARAATPAPANDPGGPPDLLFVQTFRAGAITPIAGVEGRYTLTLERGHGQTVYFSDRPDRVVGATQTEDFLDRLGFPDDDPPNAALVVETAAGETDVAVVELFSPIYDKATGGVTYEIEVLDNWAAEMGVGLQEAPKDLAVIEPSFGAAHLFIDGLLDCPGGEVVCHAYGTGEVVGTIPGDWFNNFCAQELWKGLGGHNRYCVPCGTPKSALIDANGSDWGQLRTVWSYWGSACNQFFPECNGNCRPTGWCEPDPYWQDACPDYA